MIFVVIARVKPVAIFTLRLLSASADSPEENTAFAMTEHKK